MSNLLYVTRLVFNAMEKDGTFPLYLEYEVPTETAPYLVSSSKSVMWIEDSRNGMVRTAVRTVTPGLVFKELVSAVIDRGMENEWGNIQPFNADGLKAAISHVREYVPDKTDLEVLMPNSKAEFKKGKGKKKKNPIAAWLRPQNIGLPVRYCSWLPEKTAVVLPVNREYVGVLTHLSPKHVVVVLQNACRTLGVAVGV